MVLPTQFGRGSGKPSWFPRLGKQAFAESENVRNRGFLKSEPEASESERQPKAGEGERLIVD